jgi:hypothetical protein
MACGRDHPNHGVFYRYLLRSVGLGLGDVGDSVE